MSDQSSTERVWLITGTSQGFGRELVAAALERGDKVVATSRSPQKVAAEFPEAGDRLLALSMDLRDEKQIATVVENAVKRFGRIDVLINNAGHGLIGAIEEASESEVNGLFEVNVFGLLRVTRAVLPLMRKQGRGHIVNLSSVSGLIGSPGFGIYNATKFAVEGLSEALAQEVRPLGIGLTIVEPGPFRTAFLGGSIAQTKSVLPEYEPTAGKSRAYQKNNDGSQPGDPVLGATAIIDAVTSDKPPLRLLLGASAYQRAQKKLADLKAEFEAWRDVSLATDFAQ